MSFGIKYSKSRRLIISGLCCDCPFEHRAITQDIYIGSGVIEGLPAMIKRRDMGKRLVLIADKQAYVSSGEAVSALLSDGGYSVTPLVVDCRTMPGETDAGRALLTMRMDTDFFVSLGAGCVTDITRAVASQTERPMAAIASAPSTTAYPSVVSKYLLNGFARSMRAVSPEIVVCDTDIIRKAPKQTIAAGFAEMMSKYLSVADWRVSRLINCEKLCPTYAQALLFAADRVLEAADEIAQGTDKGVQTLTESLILSGLIIAMTGTSRAVESSEHAIADGYIMQRVKNGLSLPEYYAVLSQAVAYCLECVSRVKALGEARLDRDALGAFDLEKELIDGFGPQAVMIAQRWPDTSKAFFERQAEAFVKRFASVKNALGDVPDVGGILGAMTRAGCFTGEIEPDAFGRACRYAPYLTGCGGILCLERLLCRE